MGFEIMKKNTTERLSMVIVSVWAIVVVGVFLIAAGDVYLW